MAFAIRLAVRIRDTVYRRTTGDCQQWIQLHDLEEALDLKIDAAVQAAVREAADAGWIRTAGGREVLSVAMTEEGIRLCRDTRVRRRRR